MADLIDDIDVELADLPAAEPKVEAEKVSPPAQKEDLSPEEGIRRLEANLAAERAKRIEAEQRANDAAQGRHQAQVEVVDTNMALVNSAISNCEQAKETLTARYAEAAGAGDWGSASEVQSLMADNAAALSQLRTGKQAMEAQGRPQAPQVQQTQQDPVEAYASQLTGYPRSAAWVRAHPEFATDARLNSKMIAAHNLAVADGLAPDSDDYFTAIEDSLRLAPSMTVDTTAQRVETRSPPAAPPSRGSGANGSKPGVIRLTPAEVEAAEVCGQTLEEYARNKQQIEKERKEGLN